MKISAIFFLIVANAIISSTIYSNTKSIEKKPNFIGHDKITDQKIKGYYNNDNLEDYIVRDSKNKDSYSVFINNGKGYTKKVSFLISEDDFDTVENPLQNLFISNPKKGEIAIGASCCASLKTTEVNYYKFFDEFNNWILYKGSTYFI